MAGPFPLSFDVTDVLPPGAAGGDRIALSGWLFHPDDVSAMPDRPAAMVLLSGGSYDKRYHHAIVPGHEGYSAAEHLSALGNVVLLLDHLGVGESSRLPDQKRATRQVCAMAADAATRQFHAGLAYGGLVPGLPALGDVLRVGGGHSMGAMQIVVQQAAHRTFDAIMVLGYTAAGVHFVLGGKKVRAADYIPQGDVPDYTRNDRGEQRGNFHWNDVPDAVMLADDALAVETPSMIGLDSIRTGIIADDAAAIDVPVFIGLGEQDVSPDPHAEAALFAACNDFTLFVLPRSAHCQTFASTRHLFWNRIDGWTRVLAECSGSGETGGT